MARPRDRAPVRRQEILRNFYEVLRDEGLEGASLARIARSMGVHPSLLIHYFSSKEQMTLALVDYIMERYGETYVDRLAVVREPGERLVAILDVLFGADWMEHVDLSVFHACHYLGFHNDKIRDRFREMYAGFREPLMLEFETLMEQGAMKRMDPAVAADLVIAMTEGLDFYGSIIGTGDRFEVVGRTMKEAALALLAGEGSERKAGRTHVRKAGSAAGRAADGGKSG